MTMTSSSSIRRLPFHEKHVQNGAKLGFFGDWEVPLFFSSILEEHEAVRSKAGIFDISHMGKFSFSGKGTIEFLDSLLPRSISKMADGQALYMPLLNEQGGMIDDIIVYRVSSEHILMIVNAGNVEKDFKWISSHVPAEVVFRDHSSELSLIALQGPKSAALLERALGDASFSKLGYYRFLLWKDGMIARTGYTGEDGFEIMANHTELQKLWDRLFEEGKPEGLAPIGFGARDTLRLEAAMLLYGHDMNDDVNPLEAGISWAIDWNKASFIGRQPLVNQKEKGVTRKLVGFEMIDRGIPRQDYEIWKSGKAIGKVTSGSFAPTLKKNIGLGYVPTAEVLEGNEIEILVRDKTVKARIVKIPFYKRKK
jgi:aminomethyltransferase